MKPWRLLAAVSAALLFAEAPTAGSTGRREMLNVGAQWDPYGAYLQRMLTSVQRKWDAVLAARKMAPAPGDLVAVKYVLDARGRVAKILDVGNTSTSDGEAACLTSLTLAAPFGPWPDDMAKALGSSQEITIRFYY